MLGGYISRRNTLGLGDVGFDVVEFTSGNLLNIRRSPSHSVVCSTDVIVEDMPTIFWARIQHVGFQVAK